MVQYRVGKEGNRATVEVLRDGEWSRLFFAQDAEFAEDYVNRNNGTVGAIQLDMLQGCATL